MQQQRHQQRAADDGQPVDDRDNVGHERVLAEREDEDDEREKDALQADGREVHEVGGVRGEDGGVVVKLAVVAPGPGGIMVAPDGADMDEAQRVAVEVLPEPGQQAEIQQPDQRGHGIGTLQAGLGGLPGGAGQRGSGYGGLGHECSTLILTTNRPL